MPDQRHDITPERVTCPHCRSRLDVMETPSGARSVSVVYLAPAVDQTALALEVFVARVRALTCTAHRAATDSTHQSRVASFDR